MLGQNILINFIKKYCNPAADVVEYRLRENVKVR